MENRSGFTVAELVVVLMVGVILTTIVVRTMSGIQNRTSVRQARDVYVAMHARTRAQAVEFGQRTLLNIDPGGDSIWISRNDSVLEVVRFGSAMGVELETGGGAATVCMNSRGFAESACNSFSSTLTLTFIQGNDKTSVDVLPLGQVLY
jgi:Tfp pilus assembly protein FimT